MTQLCVAHLILANPERGTDRVAHIIAVPADRLERPSVLITEDGKCWMFGAEYLHFPNTCFYLEVQPAFFSNTTLKALKRAVPVLDRARAI